MSDTLTIGSLAAERGQKLRGWLPVPGTSIQLPLTLIQGARPGPTLLVTGGIHGYEYPGIEAAIQLARARSSQHERQRDRGVDRQPDRIPGAHAIPCARRWP